MLSELSSLLYSKLFFDFYFDENHKLDLIGQEFKTKYLSIFICNTTPFSTYLYWKEISKGTFHNHSFEILALPFFSYLCHFHRQKFSSTTQLHKDDCHFTNDLSFYGAHRWIGAASILFIPFGNYTNTQTPPEVKIDR
jgi:hypothetical protein